jgi:hypothetical protein
VRIARASGLAKLVWGGDRWEQDSRERVTFGGDESQPMTDAEAQLDDEIAPILVQIDSAVDV